MIEVNADITKLKDQLLKDAAELKICRNCKNVYMREDQEWGYCKLNRKDRPVEVPLSVHEYHTCKHWKSKIKEEDE